MTVEDANGSLHGDDGRFVSPRQTERDWDEHDRDHERERQVAKETAQRLEREVRDTAQRIERTVEETANRLQSGVTTALKSAEETAKVHSEAHDREHSAHERIHTVEKTQVDKAERSMNERLERMNEFRAALQDAAARMVTRDVLDAYMKDREHRLQAVIDRLITLEKSQVSEERVDSLRAAYAEEAKRQREDSKRQRNGFMLAVGLLGLGVIVNLLVNLLQAG